MSCEDWSALILAGGAGRRFAKERGGGKLLADLAGAPVIRRVAEGVLGAGFAEVLIVTGAQGNALRPAIEGLACRLVDAPDWAEGMAASLRAGVAALAPQVRGVCIFLGDMPLVPVQLCAALAAAADRSGYAARPRHAGKPGHPVAFTRAAFADLAMLQGDTGATALLAGQPGRVAYVETADRGVLLDIDTLGDLAAAVAAWKA